MALTAANASYVMDETISAFAFDTFIQEPMMLPALFTMRPSNKDREVSGSMSALGNFVAKSPLAEASESDPVQQYSKEYSHTPYALQTKFSRELIDDQKFQLFGEFGQKMGQSASRTMEGLAADIFNNAFTSTLAEDALSLCNGAHVNVDGGNSISNSGTSSLSHSSYTSTRSAQRAFTDYTGNKIHVNPDAIMVGNGANEEVAFEIAKSSLRSDNANNAANFHQNLKVFVWLYLSSDSGANTNWFSIDTRLMAQNLFWYQRMPLEIFGDGDLFKGQRRIGGYFRSAHGVTDWRWVYGHNA